jgi:hypothetical protein
MTFFDIYREELHKSVTKTPSDYALRPEESPAQYAERVADKIIATMTRTGNVHEINIDTPTFRRTCKRMGIGYNRKQITLAIQETLKRVKAICDGQ